MNENKNFFRASAEDFKKIPGAPVAYWLTDGMFAAMGGDSIGRIVDGRMGLTTGNNDVYLRLWFEIGFHKIGFGYDRQSAKESGLKWFPYNKAGEFRRWYGNLYYVVDWKTDGRVMQTTMHPDGKRIWAHNFNLEYNFLPHFSWSDITSGMLSFRWYPKGCLFDASANAAFSSYSYMYLLGLTNASFVKELSVVLNPTIHFKLGDFYKIPFVEVQKELVERNVSELIDYARKDWDSYETSWDFKVNPLVAEWMREVAGGEVDSGMREVDRGQWIVDSGRWTVDSGQWIVDSGKGEVDSGRCPVDSGQWIVASATNHYPLTTNHSSPLSALYAALRCRWAAACEEMRRLEIENNRIFIEAYGLQDELTPDVPWNEITLICNPWYRYGVREVDSGQWPVDSGKGEVVSATNHSPLTTNHSSNHFPLSTSLEARLKMDTVKELVSYAVGCMMGRYSLEKPGLILADQGAKISDKWIVVSGQYILKERLVERVREELQRTNCLAEGDGSCRQCVSAGEGVTARRAVCLGGSAASCGGVDSVEHCGRSGAEHDTGLRELPDDGARVLLRDGNAVVDLCSSEILDAIERGTGAELVRRGWTDAERVDWKALHSSLTGSHLGEVASGQWEVASGKGEVVSGQWIVDSGESEVDSGKGEVVSGQWIVDSATNHSPLTTIHSPNHSSTHSPLTTNHFSPDDDGIIPVLDNDWFADDIVTRFKAFVKAAFGEKHFFENMAWIEEALGKDIRSYFTKDFYKDHLQRYQNRPIYWLFQSPKGAFRALIYMHRYRPDMVGGVLGYLRSLQTKIDNQLDVAMRIGADEAKSASERVQANKDVVKYARAKKELDEYEKNVLYPLSTERIEIDLDDGVKVNYRKFGAALAKVKALE